MCINVVYAAVPMQETMSANNTLGFDTLCVMIVISILTTLQSSGEIRLTI